MENERLRNAKRVLEQFLAQARLLVAVEAEQKEEDAQALTIK